VIQARNSLIQSRRADLDLFNELFLSATGLTASAAVPIESLTVDPTSVNTQIPQ
jgi:hypothetical protein